MNMSRRNRFIDLDTILLWKGNGMNQELEVAKVSLKSANDYADIKSNLVVESVLIPILKAVPVIGDI